MIACMCNRLIDQLTMSDLQIPWASMWYRNKSERCERFSPEHSIAYSCNQELHLACKVFAWTLSRHAYGHERSGRASGSNCNKTRSRWRSGFPYKENGSQKVSTYAARVLFPLKILHQATRLYFCFSYITYFKVWADDECNLHLYV